ncbi:MAG: hypothetical protein Q8M03_17010 [Legionella sp.]|nr:hypothetical protein [Legionella sp.]
MSVGLIKFIQGLFLCLLMMTLENVFASIEVKAISPDNTNTLHYGQAVYLRLHYNSTQSLSFQVIGLKNGAADKDGITNNRAALYPAGLGEAIAWIAYDNDADIDALMIMASDYKGSLLETQQLPLALHWQNMVPVVPRLATWVQVLSQQQLSMATNSPDPQSLGWVLLTQLFFLFIPIYLFFQINFLCVWSGQWRRKAAFPLLITIPVLIFTWIALLANSTWWLLLLGVISPFALLYLLKIHAEKKRHEAGNYSS